MATLFEYIHTNHDKTFDILPINEIDFLIFNELIYLPFDQYLTEHYSVKHPLKITDLYQLYWLNHQAHHRENGILATIERHRLFNAVVQTKRYEQVQICAFRHNFSLDTEKQFCAATLLLPSNEFVVVFRGTDDTLIGWKEDFKMAYNETIPAQLDAANYVQDILTLTEQHFYITGHSKGGNLALYAALSLEKEFQDRIIQIFLFDSPGMPQSVTQSANYNHLKNKSIHFIPEDSIVGRMMYHNIQTVIIKSRLISLFQHNVLNWEIEKHQIRRAEKTTEASDILDRTLKEWCMHHSQQELSDFFDYAFALLDQAGITTLNQVNHHFFEVAKKINHLSEASNPNKRQHFHKIGLSLIAFWRKNYQELQLNKKKIREEAMRQMFTQMSQHPTLEERMNNIENWIRQLDQ